jgi:phage replication-related protein YjqB (UPF0714/DUF867 family)
MPYSLKFSKYGLKENIKGYKSRKQAARLAKNLKRLGYKAKVVKIKGKK